MKGNASKVTLDFTAIADRLRATHFPPVDVVVGIATGGIVPASLAAFHLHLPLKLISINFRDPTNAPQRPAPELLAPFDLGPQELRVLLVDDVSVSGRTVQLARQHLQRHRVTTLVMKGQGDIVLFPAVDACVNWPWKAHTAEVQRSS